MFQISQTMTTQGGNTSPKLLRQNSENVLSENFEHVLRLSSPESQVLENHWFHKKQTNFPAVSYVLVMGFHATKGCCLEYAYPRLELDNANIVAQGSDLASPVIVSNSSPTAESSDNVGTASLDAANPLERQLVKSLHLLTSMALPDGVHEREDDSVFFRVGDSLFGVACFRQVAAKSLSSFSADPRASVELERNFASRGTVQKSVVLLSRYPLFGVLLEHLRPVVSIYFEQGDFRKTNILAQLYHSVNAALSYNQHCLYSSTFLYHGLELRRIIRRLGFHTLRIVKLLLLEKKVLFHSSPVESASNAVLSLASIFPGGLSHMAKFSDEKDTTVSVEQAKLGFPLNCFNSDSLCVLEPYAPLQRLQELLGFRRAVNGEEDCRNPSGTGGFLAGTSRNLGLLIASMTEHSEQNEISGAALNPPDAFVDITLGEVHYAPWVEDLCKLTKSERRFMENLISIISNSFSSRLGRFRTSHGKYTDYLHSEEYARERFHEYLQQFLISIATTPNVLNQEAWSSKFDKQNIIVRSDLIDNYGLSFCQAWLSTNICDAWRKNCDFNALTCTKPVVNSKLPPKFKTENTSPPHLPVHSSSCTTSPLQKKSRKVDSSLVFHGYHSDSGDDEATVSDRLKRFAINLSSRWNTLLLGNAVKYQKNSEISVQPGVCEDDSVYKDSLPSSYVQSQQTPRDEASTGVAVIDTQDIVEGLF